MLALLTLNRKLIPRPKRLSVFLEAWGERLLSVAGMLHPDILC